MVLIKFQQCGGVLGSIMTSEGVFVEADFQTLGESHSIINPQALKFLS